MKIFKLVTALGGVDDNDFVPEKGGFADEETVMFGSSQLKTERLRALQGKLVCVPARCVWMTLETSCIAFV